MRIEISGEFITSADYEVLHSALSRLVINTEDRWHKPDYIYSYTNQLLFEYYSETTEECIWVLSLVVENESDKEVIDRIRYTLQNKDQHEIMFINEEFL
jgi:hypothetical protein